MMQPVYRNEKNEFDASSPSFYKLQIVTQEQREKQEDIGELKQQQQHHHRSLGTILPSTFQPSPHTVIIGRGKAPKQNPGNKRLLALASSYLQRYQAGDKTCKSNIVSDIIDKVRQAACGETEGSNGAFVRKEKSGQWYEVDNAIAREKVGYVFRDLLADEYKSSSKSKVARRQYNMYARPMEEREIESSLSQQHQQQYPKRRYYQQQQNEMTTFSPYGNCNDNNTNNTKSSWWMRMENQQERILQLQRQNKRNYNNNVPSFSTLNSISTMMFNGENIPYFSYSNEGNCAQQEESMVLTPQMVFSVCPAGQQLVEERSKENEDILLHKAGELYDIDYYQQDEDEESTFSPLSISSLSPSSGNSSCCSCSCNIFDNTPISIITATPFPSKHLWHEKRRSDEKQSFLDVEYYEYLMNLPILMD